MKTMQQNKQMFFVAAMWNLGLCTVVLSVSIFQTSWLEFFGVVVPPSLGFLHIMLGLIITFGIGYYMVSVDPLNNLGIVRLGVIGKLIFFGGVVAYYFKGDVNLIPVFIATIDFLFVLAFVRFLYASQKIEPMALATGNEQRATKTRR